MDKVSDSGFEDSWLDSWLARTAVFLRRGHSTAERRQCGLRWFQPVLFVIVVPLFVPLTKSRCISMLMPSSSIHIHSSLFLSAARICTTHFRTRHSEL